MKKLRLWHLGLMLLLGEFALVCVGAQVEAEPEVQQDFTQLRDIVKIGDDLVLKKDEAARQVVVVFGSATIDGQVDSDLVVIGGNVTLNGVANENLVVILGSVRLGPKAVVGRDLTLVGGPLHADPGAKINGQSFQLSLGSQWLGLDWCRDWLAKGLLWGRPFPPQLAWLWVFAGIMFVVYLFLTVTFPRPLRACVDVLDAKPLLSFFSGILAMLLIFPALLLLLASVAGIPVIPFILCGVGIAFVFGKAAVCQYTGRQLARQAVPGILERPVLALIIGMAIICLLYMVPVVGFLVWGFLAALSLGSVMAAIATSFKRAPARRPIPAPAPVTPMAAASPTADPAFVPNASGTATYPMPGLLGSSPVTPTTPPLAATDVTLLPRAGFWIRFCATLIDLLLLTFLMVMVHFWPLIWIAYHLGMWAWKGTTIGGIVLGLKIIRLDGRPLDFAVVLVRCLSAFLSAVPMFLGFFWAGWDRDTQSWHDKIAGTVIVKVPRGTSLI